MEDIQVILSSHNRKIVHADSKDPESKIQAPTNSKIPDLFFDEILVEYKLTRAETLVLMFLYRVTWCKPNLHVKHGIAPMLSHQAVCTKLDLTMELFLQTVKKLETYGFIETIRAGQYFVRKYFTEINDLKYGQTYDNFL